MASVSPLSIGIRGISLFQAENFWIIHQNAILENLAGLKMVLAGKESIYALSIWCVFVAVKLKLLYQGDGRCDSPGTCAKYCSYSLMDFVSNLIVHSETIDK